VKERDLLKRLQEMERGKPAAAAPAPTPLGKLEGCETPALLAETLSEGRLRRTALWALFDRVALALRADEVDNVLLSVPPQHGKSEFWSRFFPAWWIAHHPAHRVVLAAYSATYAGKWGRRVRDLFRRHPDRFGLRVREDVYSRSEWELRDHEGGMVTAGIEGGIAGRPAELAIADDIIADVATAASRVMRDRAWDWWEEELCSRLQRGGKRVLLMTRRAEDDPVGRILELVAGGREQWAVITLPAIAEEDEYWPRWGWSRRRGEALVPELHPLQDLERVREARGQHVWAGLYQQRPYPRGGGDLKSEWFRVVEADPERAAAVRAWDLAGSESKRAKRTAGVLMTKRQEGGVGKYHVSDIRVGRWNPGDRDRVIRQTAELDGRGVPVIIEQEPGSGGLAQVAAIVSMLAGWNVKAVPASGDKSTRADPLAAQASVGNVTVRLAPWTAEFLAEVDSFPDGPTIDMVDAAAHAFNWLTEHLTEAVIPASFNPMSTCTPGLFVLPSDSRLF
jgi:predicted phage terminase large subunit-like protein